MQKTNEFGFVQPFFSEEKKLDPASTNVKIGIPEELSKKNLLIEIANKQNGLK